APAGGLPAAARQAGAARWVRARRHVAPAGRAAGRADQRARALPAAAAVLQRDAAGGGRAGGPRPLAARLPGRAVLRPPAPGHRPGDGPVTPGRGRGEPRPYEPEAFGEPRRGDACVALVCDPAEVPG